MNLSNQPLEHLSSTLFLPVNSLAWLTTQIRSGTMSCGRHSDRIFSIRNFSKSSDCRCLPLFLRFITAKSSERKSPAWLSSGCLTIACGISNLRTDLGLRLRKLVASVVSESSFPLSVRRSVPSIGSSSCPSSTLRWSSSARLKIVGSALWFPKPSSEG